MAPPRIVLFPYVGSSVGGSHVSSLGLVRNLPRDRYTPVVGLHQSEGVLAEYLRDRDIPFIALPDVALPTMGSLRRQLPVFARATGPLRKLIKQHGIDIVHTNDIRMHQLWGLPCRLAGIPHIWHQRSATRGKRLDSYARLATRVISVSEYTSQELPPRLRSMAQVIINPFSLPNPPNRAQSRARLLAELGQPETSAVIGFVGNFTAQKRPMAIVELAQELRKRGRANSVYPMFGEPRPPLGPEIDAAIAAAGLQGSVVPMGPRFPIEPWIAGFDILVAPAGREAFGRAPIEAMLCGTPVIASDDGGHREIVTHGETGLLVPLDDTEALARAVRTLLDAPEEAARLAHNAATAARQRFSVPAHVAAVTELYDSC